ncbi:MAG: metalloregulator ArsR/SmtB family transcription factor [Nitriliruptorales bacterium]|nr:metalloregulator ArsR/SmtB family transcription factor [Nitriliruptorales bacterium]
MSTKASDDAVFAALANPHRRAILDLLATEPRTTGELADQLTEISRYAVMQHLGVLVDANLVVFRREGRRRINFLHAVPLREIYERWISELADEGAAQLLALKRHIEGDRHVDVRAERIETDMSFNAPASRVMTALTTETSKWFPATYGEDRVQQMVFDARVGGRFYEDWGNGAGWDYGVITAWDPPRRLSLRRQLYPGVTLDTDYQLEEADGTTTLKVTKVAVGPMGDDEVAAFQHHGDPRNFEDALRAHVEA